jgi:hypothetical protein
VLKNTCRHHIGLTYIKHELFKKKAIKKLPPFLDAWSNSSSFTFIFPPAQRKNFYLLHLRECCWYLECKRTWQPYEEAALKIRLSGGERPLPSAQSDEVVLLDSQLPEEANKVVAPLEEANTQKSKRRKRATQDESSLNKHTRKLKMVEDDPPASPEAAASSTATLSQVPTLSRPPPPLVLSSARPPPVVSECILNASILYQRRHFHVVSDFILSLPPSHTRRALGVRRLNVGMVDLVISNIAENLSVPNVSDPAHSVLSWNTLDLDFLGEFFNFADEIIHDDGALLLFHPVDNGDFRKSIQDHFHAFGFTIFKEWLGVNRLRLHSAKHMDKTTNLFQVVLLVRATKTIGSDHDKRPRHSSFHLRDAIEFKALGIELEIDDVIMNYTTTPLIDGSKAWRGSREKDIFFMSSLIMATTDIGEVVVDVTASIGMSYFTCHHIMVFIFYFSFYLSLLTFSFAIGTSVHACRQLGRHIIALEEDEDIFNRILQPLKSVKPPVKASSIVVASTQASQGTQKRPLALKRSRLWSS